MSSKIYGAIIFFVIAVLIFAPIGFSGVSDSDVVITYGETTYIRHY